MHYKWIALFVGLLAIATALSAAQAEDPPADPKRVLREAGLMLKGNTYILVAEIELELIEQKIHEIREMLNRRINKYNELMDAYLMGKKAAAQLKYPQDSSFDRTGARRRVDEANSKWALSNPVFHEVDSSCANST
ncbi:MAG: hypothetical protein WKF75_07725, partial [Singulisphaera sp.]